MDQLLFGPHVGIFGLSNYGILIVQAYDEVVVSCRPCEFVGACIKAILTSTILNFMWVILV